MPSIDESGEGSISLETFLAVGIALIVLASIFIALRLGASIKKKGRLFADDCVCPRSDSDILIWLMMYRRCHLDWSGMPVIAFCPELSRTNG